VLQKKLKITALDILILLAVAGVLAYTIYQIKVKLNYNWKWEIIPQYLFRYDEESGKWVSNYLIHGLLTTLRLSFWGTLLATIFGTLMGLLRVSKSLFHRMIARSYVELMRNLPPLVIIFIFYSPDDCALLCRAHAQPSAPGHHFHFLFLHQRSDHADPRY
jgi:polar amino acid transport system permease protein